MEWWVYVLIGLAIFAFGFVTGCWVLRTVWLEPGFKMGFIQDGDDAYSITRKRRNK